MMASSDNLPTTQLPDGWDFKSLKEIAPKVNVGLVINPSTYFDDGGTIPMLVGSNLSVSGIDWRKANRITEESNALLKASRIRTNDVLVVRVGEPGIAAVVPPKLNNANCASLIIVRQNPSYSSQWLKAAFNSPLGRFLVSQSQYGTAQKVLNIGDAVKLHFPVPPLKEQEAIAEALSDADALIEGLERLIAKKRLIKQGAMQDLLTAKRRLPGFSGEWVETPLGDVGPFVGGGTPSMARTDFWKDGTTPWVSSSDIRVGELHGADRMITGDAVRGSSTRVVDPGSILFVTRSGILRRFQPVMINTVPVAINQDIKALLPRSSEYSATYIFHAAVGAGDQILRDCMKTGTTVESIDLNALRRFRIDCPKDRDEQDAIAAVLTDMDAEIQALETRLEKARQVKEGMMQNLLTGRIRLV